MEERLGQLVLDDENSNDLWSRAINTLDHSVVTNINFSYDKLSILSDLKNEVEEAQKDCEKKRVGYTRKRGEKIALRDVFGKIVKWINIFKAVGDQAVQYDPAHAALPWALVRFLLQVSVADIEKYEFLVENIEVVSRYICRCRLLEKLYVGEGELNSDFKAAMVRLYGQILLYLGRAKGYFDKQKIVRIALSAFRDKSEFEAVMDKISKAFDDVNKSAALIRREEDCARYSEFKIILQEQSIKIEEMAAQVQSLGPPIMQMTVQIQNFQDNLDSMKRRRILQWMSDTEKLPYLKHHKENKRQILPGTGEWLLKDEIYNYWKESPESSLLWLHGIPGSGKSKLTSLVIEDNLECCKRGTILRPAFFYCSRNPAEPARSDSGSILASIARQIANLSPTSALLPPVVEKYNEEEEQGNASGTLDIDDARELILELVALYPITTIIIDALDECPREERAVMIDFIKTLIRNSSNLVKFFISSREDGDIVFHLEEFPSLRISSGKNQVDIEAFVEAETRRLVESGSLLRHSQKQRQLMDEIMSRVAKDAKGMFRWASLQLQSLTELKTDADVLLRLGKVPSSLQQLYLEIYQTITTNHGPVSQVIARNAMNLLLGAKDDFTLPMFLVSVTPDKSQRISVEELLDICCNLIVLDETSKIIRFAHLSVREFLEDMPEYTSSKVNSGISSICLAQVASWNSFGPSVRSGNYDPTGKYINRYLRYHLHEAGSQERLKILLKQLLLLLQMVDFQTLEDRSLKFWTTIRNPPNHIEPAFRWVFNACAFGFHEIVERVIEKNVLMHGGQIFGANSKSPPALHRDGSGTLSAFDDISTLLDAFQTKCVLIQAPYTCFKCLALHAIQCQSYTVLSRLLERNPCILSDNSILPCMCTASEPGLSYSLVNFHGLKYVTADVIREAVQSVDVCGDGKYNPAVDNQPLVVQDLVEGGLQFPVTKEFLDSIKISNRWVLESVLILLENDPNCAISTITKFMEAIVPRHRPRKVHLQKLFRTCNEAGAAQKVFEDLSAYCRSIDVMEWLLEVNAELSITEVFLRGFISNKKAERIFARLCERTNRFPRFARFCERTNLFPRFTRLCKENNWIEIATQGSDPDFLVQGVLRIYRRALYSPTRKFPTNLITQSTLEHAIERCYYFETIAMINSFGRILGDRTC